MFNHLHNNVCGIKKIHTTCTTANTDEKAPKGENLIHTYPHNLKLFLYFLPRENNSNLKLEKHLVSGPKLVKVHNILNVRCKLNEIVSFRRSRARVNSNPLSQQFALPFLSYPQRPRKTTTLNF